MSLKKISFFFFKWGNRKYFEIDRLIFKEKDTGNKKKNYSYEHELQRNAYLLFFISYTVYDNIFWLWKYLEKI